MNTVLNSLMTSPAPILESLDLEDPNPVISEERVVLCDIFNTQAPMLRRLQLRCLQLSWSAPLLRGLVYLHIDNQDDPRREPATDDVTGYNQFFSALREMSALETLFLSHCLPVKPGDPPKIQTVMLPHVKKLTLGGGLPVECKNIIKHLAMPPLCDVTIECEELGPRPSESTFSFVKAHTLSFANQQPLLAMFLSTTQGRHSFYDPKWQLRFWPAGSAADLANLRRDRGGVPSISILVDRLRDDFHHSVKDLSECIQKDIIRDLIIESDGVLDWTLTYEDWLDIFEDYMEVENISVRGDVARTLCATLDTSTSYPMDWERLLYGEDGSELCESQIRLFFAKLKRIEFKQVDFNGLSETDRLFEHNENGGGYRTISTSVYNILKSSLSHRRRQSDIPLTLFIRQCSIDADQIRGLEEIAEVSWDFIEDPSNEDESGKD
ncbi:hypothetical protein EWM64_g8051 [Hericium alpestre]|uniref:Uncharacterized protein n=1 Tax=Hericium alpestre TaxID=135208 RepID=A0A4Y9ZNX3_9AGAM|nr:hypothetical protein EWM64_g8051 [Hericium alpestre]